MEKLEKFSSKQLLCSAIMATAFLIGNPQHLTAAEASPLSVAAPQDVVRGTVVDVNGEPIPGASVRLKGSNIGTTSDLDGKFSIEGTGTLIISFVGYETQEVTARRGSVLNVTLREDSQILDDVVVVGYGMQKKATLTGAVAQVQGDEVLKGRAASNVGTALQGAIPGMTITRPSSRPTENAKISIRGGISANASAMTLTASSGVLTGSVLYREGASERRIRMLTCLSSYMPS